MSYQPLARKYRPATFHELIGQDAVALAIANGIRLGREPRAVIFSGVRGVGKTTVARLYAKALNCGNGPSADPCNQCASCEAINHGVHEDVLEIDGASNTSVDDVRALRETIGYMPQRSKFKVYIIDEVHMLSQSAFNALLKTLEEPPRHVVFVFATTELNKVPSTIVSRCQTFYLQKLTINHIKRRVRTILDSEGVEYDEAALSLVAREGHGSMRDALTFLDQAIALGGGRVTADALQEVLQRAGSAPMLGILRHLLARDAQAVLAAIESLDQSGTEMVEMVESVARFCRDAMVAREVGVQSVHMGMLDLDESELATVAELGKLAANFDLNRIFRTLMKCRADLSGGDLDRYVVENCLLEWCLDPGIPSIEDLLRGNAGGVSGSGRPAPARVSQPTASAPVPAPVKQQASATPPPRLTDALKSIRQGVEAGVQPVIPVTAAAQTRVSSAEAPTADTVASTNITEPTASVVSSPSAEGPGASSTDFPPTWRAMVDEWQKQKPLQARIFEDTRALEYGTDRIVLAVYKDSLAGRKLIQRETQAKALEQIRAMFRFAGLFAVVETEREVVAAPSDEAAALPVEETVLQTKQRERHEERERVREQLCSDPVTQATLAAFGGKIEGVTF